MQGLRKRTYPFVVATLISSFWGTSAIGATFPLKNLKDFDIQKKVSKIGTKTLYEYFDTKTKNTLLYQYDAEDLLESIEVRNSLGKTVEKTRFLPNRLWRQTGDQLDEWITNENGRNIHRITDLSGKKKPVEVPYEPNTSQTAPSCNKATTNDVEKSVDVVKDLQLRSNHRLGDAQLKMNGCDQYPGGDQQLVRDMQEAVNTGVECLGGASPESKIEATKLLAYFQNPQSKINLHCAAEGKQIDVSSKRKETLDGGTMARSLTPPDEGSPGMLINLNSLKDVSTTEKKATLFHEMLHWLGILHQEVFDTPYIAENCCMAEDKNSALAKKSCDLLKKSPRPSPSSKEYLGDFTDMMLLNYRSSIPSKLIRDVTSRKVATEKPIDLSGPFEANKKIQTYGNSTADVQAYAFKKLDPTLTVADPSFDSPRAQAAKATGDVVARMYEKSSYDDFAASLTLLKMEYVALLNETKDPEEKKLLKEDIEKWSKDFYLLSFDVKSPSDYKKPSGYELWNKMAEGL